VDASVAYVNVTAQGRTPGGAHTAATALGLTTAPDVSKCCGRTSGAEGRRYKSCGRLSKAMR